MKVKGGEFRNLEDVLQKLQEENPYFVKLNKLKMTGLKAHEDGRVEVTARVRVNGTCSGLKYAMLIDRQFGDRKGKRGVALEVKVEGYLRQDDMEMCYSERYFLRDYRVNPNAPALPKKEPKPEAPKPEAPKKDDEKRVREMLGRPDFEMALEKLVAHVQKLQEKDAKQWAKQFPNSDRKAEKVSVEYAKRYAKVKADGRTWAFVDTTNGDILKPASWKAPAKHARGNVYDPNSWGEFSAYGPQYLR